ncbi:MAG: M20/M25/M40 family metallo-hydrolase, partial [Hyphomicrobiales bacterium]|nr:M20/M25/M40 family metallo-hydrolase [Hyphomicrobiales bacterium]
CRLDIERRTIPGEAADQVRAELQAIIDRLAAQDPAFSASLEIGVVRQPFEVAEDAAILTTLREAYSQVLGQPVESVGEPWWTDAALFSAAGIPTVLFGPYGEGEHGEEEWIDLDSLHSFAQVLARTTYDFCGGRE